MSKSNGSKLMAMALLTAASTLSKAQGFYVGGAVAAPDYTEQINGRGDGGGGRGPGLKLYGGYQWTPYLALEAGGFNLGRTRNVNDGSATAYGSFLDGVASYELAPRWSVLGRLGVARARFTTPSGNDNGTGLKLGAGLQYDLTPTMAVRIEYERYRFGSVFDQTANVGQTSVGLKLAF